MSNLLGMIGIDKQPLVSVVVTTKNEEKHIGNCLLSIQEQSYPNIETIVVDNASTDKTKQITKDYTNLVFDKGPERSAQRNYGMIDIAQGKYVMFIDADMILSPCLVDACVCKLEKENVAALYISEIILGTSYWCKVRRFERSFYDATVVDSARIYRRNIFCKVGGFDEDIDFGEEWDLDKEVKQHGAITLLNKKCDSICMEWKLAPFIENLGISRSIEKNAIYHNESEFEVNTYITKKGKYAQGFDKYITKWGKSDPEIKKQFGLWYRFFGVFIEHGKWEKMSRHPVLFFGMYWLRFMVGLKYLLCIK